MSEEIFLPYQKEWANDASPILVYEKSRRIGVTWTDAAIDVLLASTQGKSGMDVWYIGYNLDMAKQFIKDCAFWVESYSLVAEDFKETIVKDQGQDILAYRINFSSGYTITALSSRPSNLRGKQGKVVIDEAAFHDDLPGLLKASMAHTIWGGKIAIISTHNGTDNPFNELVEDIRAGRKNYSLHRTTLDEALEQGLYKKICEVKKLEYSPAAEQKWRDDLISFYGSDADEELHVIPNSFSGAYMSRSLIESRMDADIPVLRWECDQGFAELPEHTRESLALDWCEENLQEPLSQLDPNLKSYLGEDFGRSGDLTVMFPVQERKNLSCAVPFLVELRNVPFKQQEQILFYICDRLPRFICAAFDAGGNGQYLAEVATQRYGSGRIHQVHLSTEWYRDNMPRYKAAFEDGTIELPKDSDILSDHRAIQMENGVAKVPNNKRGKGTDGGQRHGDSAIAGAMALFARNQDGCEIAFKSTGKKRISTKINNYVPSQERRPRRKHLRRVV